MKKLLIVESPNKIKIFQKYLGNKFLVNSTVGHFLKLPNSGPHRFGVDMNTWEPNYKIDPKKKELIKKLKKQIKQASHVFIATDHDREGEAIGENIVSFFKINQNQYSRLIFNEITEEVILDSLKKPQKINYPLVNSQKARQILDKIIGYKLSSLMRKKILNWIIPPSAGRVQSIALKLIVDREKEVEKFIPIIYNVLKIEFKHKKETLEAIFYNSKNKYKDKTWLENNELLEIKKQIKSNLTLKLININITNKKSKKLIPFKQSALYKKASSLMGMSTYKIRFILQKLYEGYGDDGLITYPRTDSTRFSNFFILQAQDYIVKKYGKEYFAINIEGKAGDQDAHEAIRPTDLTLSPLLAKEKYNLKLAEFKLYNLIWMHSLQVLMNPPIKKITRYEFMNNDLKFYSSFSQIVFDGYLKIIDKTELTKIPDLQKDQIFPISKLNITNHQTLPPARYNGGSLIEQLDKIKVGRPSTFPIIIENLKKRDYIQINNKQFIPTIFGKTVATQLIKFFPQIMEETYTAKLENKLNKIAHNDLDYKTFLFNFWEKFYQKFLEIFEQMKEIELDIVKIDFLCPECQSKQLILRANKMFFTKFYGCANFPECKYTISYFKIDENNKEIIKKTKKVVNKKKPVKKTKKAVNKKKLVKKTKKVTNKKKLVKKITLVKNNKKNN